MPSEQELIDLSHGAHPGELPIRGTPEYLALIEGQLAGAIMMLRTKDASDEATVLRIDAKYRGLLEQVQNSREKLQRTLGPNAARYQFLRQHLVQVWKLGIAASDSTLDVLLDKQIELALQTEKEG